MVKIVLHISYASVIFCVVTKLDAFNFNEYLFT